MADYNRWMNQRVYAAAAELRDEQLFEDRRAFFGSLFDTLNHLVVADLIWLNRFAQIQPLGEVSALLATLPSPTTLTQRLAQTLGELQGLRTNVDRVITSLANGVTEHHLAQTLHYRNTAGKQQAKILVSCCSTSSITKPTTAAKRARFSFRRALMLASQTSTR
jgi:uncharacterized damage-inducible protein DinB